MDRDVVCQRYRLRNTSALSAARRAFPGAQREQERVVVHTSSSETFCASAVRARR